MTHFLTVEGPLAELASLREEILTQYNGHVVVSDLHEKEEDLLSPGGLGDSPIASFVIQLTADLSAAGIIATIAGIKVLISRRKSKIQTMESEVSDKDG